LRTQKIIELKGETEAEAHIAMTKSFIYDAADRIHKAGKDALNSFAEGDDLRMLLMGIKRFTKHSPMNIKNEKRKVAEKLIAANEYCF
jgi:hypothetical protein